MQHLTDHTTDLYGFCVSPDGIHLFSGGDDGIIRQWEIESGRLLKKFNKDHSSWIEGLACTRDARFIFTGSGDYTSRMYNVTHPFNMHTKLKKIAKNHLKILAARDIPQIHLILGNFECKKSFIKNC